MSATSCPTKEQLQSLVSGTMPSALADATTEHLGECARCQTAIQRAAGTVSSAELPIEALVGQSAQMSPAKDSAYWQVINSVSGDWKSAEPASGRAETQASVLAVKGSDGAGSKTPTLEATSPVAMPFLKPSDDPAYIGRLHHFEISRIIGRGGMGIVFEAFDTHLQRIVAIKVLNPEYAKNDVARQRFCREGRAAAAISHEHVVAMHQVAREDEGDVAFLVMQYIEGETLENLLQGGKALPVAEATRLAMETAAGLASAHSREMVHRDIKPANILIERSTGRVKLTDFGLARATDDVRLTKTGMVTGTPLYMSPEQATGESADEKSDLFSLGAVLYEMLTGGSPFEAPSIVGVMKRIMDETPESPTKLDADIPLPLSELTMAMLEKNPAKRPESASFVAETLAKILATMAPHSRIGMPMLSQPNGKTMRSGTHRLVSQTQLRTAWAVGLVGIASLLVAAALFIASQSQPNLVDGAVADASQKATEIDAPVFPSTILPGNPGTVWAVDFDPEGEKIVAAIEDGTVRLWDVENQKVLRSFDAHRGIVWIAQYHPTRSIVATSGDDAMVKIWDAETLELLQEWKANNAVRKIAFSPDGTRIVGGDRDGVLHVWHIDSGQELSTITQAGSILGVDWSADGRLIASAGSNKTVHVWDAETLESRQTFRGHSGPVYNVSFAPMGSRLASVGWGKEIFLWDTATGQEESKLVGASSDNWSVAFCADGTHAVVASQDGKCRVWDLASGELVATLAGHESAIHNVSLDPIHRRIATSGRDGTIRVWDLSSLE